MRILDRLVTTTFLKIFVLFCFFAPILFIVGDLVDNIEDFLDTEGMTLVDVATYYAYLFPQFLLWAFPIAALVASVFTIHGMTAHREVVAAKAGGISFQRLTFPIVVCATLLAGIAFALSDLVPRTNHRATLLLEGEERSNESRTRFVFEGEGGRTLTIELLTIANSTMNGVVIEWDEVVGTDTLRHHLTADRMVFDTLVGWTAHQGWQRTIYPDGTESAFRFERYRDRGLPVRPFELLERPRDDEEMTYAEITRQAEITRRSGGDPTELIVKRDQRPALAVATLVIVLFGAPLATSSRRGGAAYGIGISLGSTILYLMLFRLTGAFGSAGAIPPLVSAWMTNVFFLVAGMLLLSRVRT